MGKLALTRIPDLAKVGVEGSNPFARSSNSLKSLSADRYCGGGSRNSAQNRPKSDAGKSGEIREARSRDVLAFPASAPRRLHWRGFVLMGLDSSVVSDRIRPIRLESRQLPARASRRTPSAAKRDGLVPPLSVEARALYPFAAKFLPRRGC